MVRVLHRHLDSVKVVTVDQGRDFGGVVVRQHETGRGIGQQLEQPWMVDLVVGIEPPAGPLATGGVGRIGEDHGTQCPRELFEQPHAIGFAEVDPIGVQADLTQAGHDGVWIPAGREPLATLAGAAQRRARGQECRRGGCG